MAEKSGKNASESKRAEVKVELRNPTLAGFLAWAIPGAGHLYQRRYFKAAIFGLSVWILMVSGIMMGSYHAPSTATKFPGKLYFARNVYCSWRNGDKRLAFIPQACVGTMALPALAQARNPRDADESFWSTAFAPPQVASDAAKRPNQPTLNDIAANLYSWLDIATIFTVVAGMMNLLAIFDAIAGPAVESSKGKDDRPDSDGGKEQAS